MDVNKLFRKHLIQVQPYSSARDEFSGSGGIFLDANENPYGSPITDKYSRYPDPHQRELKQTISEFKKISASRIFLGNGSDEAIDLIIRLFCEPQKDSIIITPPTYSMYEVTAKLHNIDVIKVPLDNIFEPEVKDILHAENQNTKLLFLCSPNNPTGNAFPQEKVIQILDRFEGIVVIDEAYSDFSPEKSFFPLLDTYNNLIVLQTFSKAYGLAGLRLGIAYGDSNIISFLDKIKLPYNVNSYTLNIAKNTVLQFQSVQNNIFKILEERKKLIQALSNFHFVEKVYHSDSNFILFKTYFADELYRYLIEQNIIIRNFSQKPYCKHCLRVTVGKPEENEMLIKALSFFHK